MKIDILTLFPEMFKGPFDESIIKRAQEKGFVEINIYNLRDWAIDRHKSVDDRSYGGGVGMILKADVIDMAVTELKKNIKSKKDTLRARGPQGPEAKVVLLDAGGKKFTQKDAIRLSKLQHLILIAGHYEGVDYRVHEQIADEVISVGDYVLTGGEIPAIVVTDAIVRLIPNVLEKSEATEFESFSKLTTYNLQPTTLLEYPQYTRPEIYKGWKVPSVLLSGNHKEIEKWRKEQSLKRTKQNRPDLLNQP